MPVSQTQVVFVGAVWKVAVCSGEFSTSETAFMACDAREENTDEEEQPDETVSRC